MPKPKQQGTQQDQDQPVPEYTQHDVARVLHRFDRFQQRIESRLQDGDEAFRQMRRVVEKQEILHTELQRSHQRIEKLIHGDGEKPGMPERLAVAEKELEYNKRISDTVDRLNESMHELSKSMTAINERLIAREAGAEDRKSWTRDLTMTALRAGVALAIFFLGAWIGRGSGKEEVYIQKPEAASISDPETVNVHPTETDTTLQGAPHGNTSIPQSAP